MPVLDLILERAVRPLVRRHRRIVALDALLADRVGNRLAVGVLRQSGPGVGPAVGRAQRHRLAHGRPAVHQPHADARRADAVLIVRIIPDLCDLHRRLGGGVAVQHGETLRGIAAIGDGIAGHLRLDQLEAVVAQRIGRAAVLHERQVVPDDRQAVPGGIFADGPLRLNAGVLLRQRQHGVLAQAVAVVVVVIGLGGLDGDFGRKVEVIPDAAAQIIPRRVVKHAIARVTVDRELAVARAEQHDRIVHVIGADGLRVAGHGHGEGAIAVGQSADIRRIGRSGNRNGARVVLVRLEVREGALDHTADLPTRGQVGRVFISTQFGVQRKLGSVRHGQYNRVWRNIDLFGLNILRAGADARRAPAALGIHSAAGDGDFSIRFDDVIGFAALADGIIGAADTRAALHGAFR